MRRRECEGEAANGLRRQPARGLARDMGGMVVENDLDRGVGWIGGIEQLEKFCPVAQLCQKSAKAQHRLLGPTAAYLGVITVSARIISSGVITEAIGQRLDEVRTAAVAGARERTGDGPVNGSDIVAVDLLAGKAGGNRLLGQRLGGALPAPRHRNRPTVVADHEDDREL